MPSTLAAGADGASPASSSSSTSSASPPPSSHLSTALTTPTTPMTPLSQEPAVADGETAPLTKQPAAPFTGPAAKHALPQNIAHRGFRARFPENSLEAFRAALDDGSGSDSGRAAAIETDVHLSKDKVVVLSHDPTLKRCFGRPEKIADCDWPLLETLRTTKEPKVPLARLTDLLAFLSEPGRENAWVLLDIKRDDDADELVSRIAETVLATPGDWNKRIVLGCWDATYIRHCQDKLPDFAISYIGFSLAYSYELLKYDCVSYFNLLQGILVGPRGKRFIREAHAKGRTVLVWTVNAEEWMDWSIRRGVDGVITDDPAKFAQIRERWKDDDGKKGGADATETTPLRVAVRPPSIPHPPATKTVTGFYLRRWARLYTIVALLRLLEQVINGIWRVKFGWERKRIQKALDR